MAVKTSPVADTKVITGIVRFSYLHVFEPAAVGDSEDKKYSVSLIIPKNDKVTIRKIKNAIEAAKEQGKASKFSGKIPANIKIPLRDGDEERPDDEAYENAYFVNASSATAPGLVIGTACDPVIDKDDFYSGCYGRASVNFFPFNASGNKGVACGLNNLQKLKDGEPLGGRLAAEDDFDDDFEYDDDLDGDDDY